MAKFNLDDDRRAILKEKSHLLVLGGPGSGKTTVALKKSLEEFEEHLSVSEKILFLSFSRTAISRIADSADEWLPKECVKQVEMQTFHSFFWSLIKSHAYLLGYPKKLSILLPHDERALSSGIKENDENWDNWLKERERIAVYEGRIAFDLFSGIALDLLVKCESIGALVCAKFPLVIVDEAQDTDDKQWRCIQTLSENTQLMVMADLEQQIYDFREGVDANRIDVIKNCLNPLCVDLGVQNNRSPDSEILDFGNSLLTGNIKNSSYKGVSRMNFQEKAEDRDQRIRQSVGYVGNLVLADTGEKANSIAILAQSNRGVLMVAKALRGTDKQKTIHHKIAFDETKALLASRVVAFLLEQKNAETNDSVAVALEFLGDLAAAKGSATGAKDSARWRKYASQLRRGEINRPTNIVTSINNIIVELSGRNFTGDPRKDWIAVRDALLASKNKALIEVADAVRYLFTFNRGKSISTGLVEAWEVNGKYFNAGDIVESALTVEQLHSDTEDVSGLHVMTMHKSKGKQFDGVIILHEDRMCPLVSHYDSAPFTKSKKLLRVSVTRASKHVLFLTGVYKPPKILDGYIF